MARQAFGTIEGVRDPTLLSPLVLAYVGDTVFDLYVRTGLVFSTDLIAHGLHMAAAKRVCASAQAAAYKKVSDMLTEEETAVFKRGRNAHIGTVPKNAAIGDYRAATGLEAVVGWLYLRGDDARLNELMKTMFEPDPTN
ncbi:MAG: ribonuclease III [Clostridia bacterium]|nr:ribonuclease III [Clostridia bacterium]